MTFVLEFAIPQKEADTSLDSRLLPQHWHVVRLSPERNGVSLR
jgi:hypothetical protein